MTSRPQSGAVVRPDLRSPPAARPRWSARGARPPPRSRLRAVRARSRCRWRCVYLTWLLSPARMGNPVLYALLIVAELFNLMQAIGFWWTCSGASARAPPLAPGRRRARRDVDVLIPVYDEPVDDRRADRRGARRMRGARVHVCAARRRRRDEMRALAARHGARYVRREHRERREGRQHQPRAAAHALAVSCAVLDCDHVPEPRFLEATLGHLADDARRVRPDAAVLRQRATAAASPRRVEPAGAVLRRDRARQGRPRARCSAAAPTSCSAGPRSSRRAASRRAR